MAPASKNPNIERSAGMPFDKDTVSPVPPQTQRPRAPGTGEAETAVPETTAGKPLGHEEYPGPQTATSGERAEPGRLPSSEPDADPGKG